MTFYLGTHEPSWLARAGVPLFVSRRRLERQHTFRRATAPWALDSGGFTELRGGRWNLSATVYADRVLWWRDLIGMLDWVAPMDWMCEPKIRAATGRTVAEHQRLTVENFLALRRLLGDLVVPVVQGWTLGEYLTCVELYRAAGVDLAAERLVGVGSVCRRNADDEVAAILDELAMLGLRLHAFGVKGSALALVRPFVASADSLAWSYRARRRHRDGLPSPTCGRRHTCANCLDFALHWRAETLAEPARPYQRTIKEEPCPTPRT